ncbi:hypothetical protein [Nitrospira defluvii]|nr:hypothetical protein [Nitrospira defluvii]
MWAEGLLARKNLAPFRISAGVFYSYHLPGSQSGETTYPSDIINTRLIIEHILDEKRGFGYNLELVGFHGLTWRADGHQVTTGGRNGFNTFGGQPTLQYRLGDHWVGAAGGAVYRCRTEYSGSDLSQLLHLLLLGEKWNSDYAIGL